MKEDGMPEKGFRDLVPETYINLAYLFEKWRETAFLYGFQEYETPLVERLALYEKKSGSELIDQLFHLEEKKEGQKLVLRPELTASLARFLAFREREFAKPIKWFSIGKCFRYENTQKGREREFFQFNADILGEESVSADAEIIHLLISSLQACGLGEKDFKIQISDRKIWNLFFEEKNITSEDQSAFLQIIDKWEKSSRGEIEKKLKSYEVKTEEVEEFMEKQEEFEIFEELKKEFKERGVEEFIRFNPKITRGLAYYNGIVFEAVAKQKDLRSIAGGGRYNELVSTLSEGKKKLPACGFAIGDCVLNVLIKENKESEKQRRKWGGQRKQKVFLVGDEETPREQILQIGSELRQNHIPAEYSFGGKKRKKVFEEAAKRESSDILFINAKGNPYQLMNRETKEKEEIPSLEEAIKTLRNQFKNEGE